MKMGTCALLLSLYLSTLIIILRHNGKEYVERNSDMIALQQNKISTQRKELLRKTS
jgi:hypothetical protein